MNDAATANELAHLRSEVDRLNALLKEVQWANMRSRFRDFKAIQNDECPCCGGRVEIEETHNAIRLKAVQ